MTFCRCVLLASVDFPSMVSEIGKNAFEGCSSLKRISFGDGSAMKGIEESTFSGCISLSEVNFGSFSQLESIGSRTFFGCGLRKILIPQNVSFVGGSAFENCSELQEVVFENESVLESISERCFTNCRSLESIQLPQKLKEICSSAFEQSGLTSIKLYSLVKTVKERAFADSLHLLRVDIGESVVKGSISKSAFHGCTEIRYVSYCGTADMQNENIFEGLKNITTVDVAAGYIYPRAFMRDAIHTMKRCDVYSTKEFTVGAEGEANGTVGLSTILTLWTPTGEENEIEKNDPLMDRLSETKY